MQLHLVSAWKPATIAHCRKRPRRLGVLEHQLRHFRVLQVVESVASEVLKQDSTWLRETRHSREQHIEGARCRLVGRNNCKKMLVAEAVAIEVEFAPAVQLLRRH